MTTVMQLAEKVVADAEETARQNVEKVKTEIPLMLVAYEKLKANGVPVPEITHTYDLTSGITVKVVDPETWGKIHKAIGPLYCGRKETIDGKRSEILVVMRPEDTNIQYKFEFQFVKKLEKKDKCKVVSRVSRSRTVQCTV